MLRRSRTCVSTSRKACGRTQAFRGAIRGCVRSRACRQVARVVAPLPEASWRRRQKSQAATVAAAARIDVILVLTLGTTCGRLLGILRVMTRICDIVRMDAIRAASGEERKGMCGVLTRIRAWCREQRQGIRARKRAWPGTRWSSLRRSCFRG